MTPGVCPPLFSNRRWRQLLLPVPVALALVLAAACSSDQAAAGSSTTSSQASDETGIGAEIIPTDARFAVPQARLDTVEELGLPIPDGRYPEQPEGVPWPTETWPAGEYPEGTDADEVQAIVDRAFGELSTDGNTTDAIVVVAGGKVVLEQYNNLGPNEAHNSWSIAKSINSALVGILVGEGSLDLWAPVDAPEWSGTDDPRSEITLDQLLRMSSGLQWEESYTDPNSDVLTTLGGGGDRAHYAADKPLAEPPDTTWSYSTGTANLISRSVAEQVGYGDQLTEWADEALFSPLGITTVEHSLDDQGLISGGSWINMSALDFARFGLLYARGGVWDGTRIVPDGWVDYSRMPTPTMGEGRYGAEWWLDPERPGMFYASGFNGQSISVVPDQDLVVVVLSTRTDDEDWIVQNALLDAFGA